jgi:hypothetical protein
VPLEVTGLDDLIVDLDAAHLKVMAGVVKAGHVFGGKVKTLWRSFDSGLAHAPGYPYTIGYDLTLSGDGIEVEIGPEAGSVGDLGWLIEYGSVNNPPHGSGARALALCAGDLEYGVGLALEKML